MTNMRRLTICVPKDTEQSTVELRKTDRFCQCSFSEIIRTLIKAGLDCEQKTTNRLETDGEWHA